MQTMSGFAPHASGLLVPDELKREREVWTREELRTLDKATALLDSRGIQVFMRCAKPDCHGAPMERIRNLDGGITYRCQHKDRVFLNLPRR